MIPMQDRPPFPVLGDPVRQERPLHYGPPLPLAPPYILQGGRQDGYPPDQASQYDWNYGPEPVPDFFSSAATTRPDAKRLYGEVMILLHKFESGGRFRMHEQLSDLRPAIALLYELLILVPYTSNPPAHSIHRALGETLLKRYRHDHGGNREDLESALIELERAFNSVPPDFIDKAPYFADLGCALRVQYEYSPDFALLERAISRQRCALELSSDAHRRQWSFLRDLAHSLLLRFESMNDLKDLDEAISLQRRAFKLMPDYPYGSQLRGELVALLRRRHERLGTLDDVDNIIAILRVALESLPDHGDILNDLSYYLEIRFKRTDGMDDLCALIGTLQRVAEYMPDAHPKKPSSLNRLDHYFQLIYERLGIPNILEQADSARRHATLSRQAVARVQSDDLPPPPTMRASKLRRFMHLDELRSEVIKMPFLAVDIIPDEFTHEALTALQASSRKYPRSSRYHLDIGMIDAARVRGPADLRFKDAMRCVSVLSNHREHCSTQLLLDAHSIVFDLIPQIFSLLQSADQRFASTSRIGTPVHEAVCLAIRAGQLSQALEWLESGRFLVWSQVITLRPPLDELIKHDASLAKEFGSVCDQLRRIGHGAHISIDTLADPADASADVLAAKRRKLIRMHENLLTQVRLRPGFEGYLFPQSVKSLLAGDDLIGTVVFLNVSTQCDALCLTSSGKIVAVELPNHSLSRAKQLLSVWSSNLVSCGVRERSTDRGVVPASRSQDAKVLFQRVLQHLWDSVVWPVLQAIGIASPTVSAGNLPHITWCVTGPLAQLPLHAAGIYTDDAGPRIYNYVVSSYTPSLSAHVHACRLQSRGMHAMPENALIITQPSTPGFPPIQKTAVEGACVEQILADSGVDFTALNGIDATITSVKSALDTSAWVHVACHGAQHRFDPTLSGFALHDGILTLNMLMSVMADDAELAFLSACQTASGDEKLSDESAHLAAGMIAAGFKGVVATMWSIKDDDGPVIVEAYYRRLLELRKDGSIPQHETGAAYALHDAVARLRELVGDGDFVRWVPFVHFGV